LRAAPTTTHLTTRPTPRDLRRRAIALPTPSRRY
jgi:hypothetical protein